MRIGILGGGQLARLLAFAGYPLGLNFTFFIAPGENSVAELGQVITADFSDQKAIERFAQQVDVITYESENISVTTLEWIKPFCKVYPSLEVLRTAQDRLLEKELFAKLNIPTAKFVPLTMSSELSIAAKALGFPFLVKTRRGGYDGKGQYLVRDEKSLTKLSLPTLTDGYIAESFVTFSREVSCIAVRGHDNNIVYYDLCENNHENGILIKTMVRKDDPLLSQAKQCLQQVLTEFDYIGTLAIEFFDVDGKLYVNEMAPRVHNTGHWTIEGAVTSQFENHCRALAGWPLGITTTLGQPVMHNIIGNWPETSQLLSIPGVHLHDYHKTPRPGRKLGHWTII